MKMKKGFLLDKKVAGLGSASWGDSCDFGFSHLFVVFSNPNQPRMSPKPKNFRFLPQNLKFLGFGLILGWVVENDKKGGNWETRNVMLSIILSIMENTRTKHGANPHTLNATNGLSNPGKNSARIDWAQLVTVVSIVNLPNARHNAHYFRTWTPNLK